MARVLILFHDDGGRLAQIARCVYAGAQKAGVEDCVLLSFSQVRYSGGQQPLNSFDLIFLQADFAKLFSKKAAAEIPLDALEGRNVAVYGLCSNSHSSKQRFKDFVARLESAGVTVKNTLMLHVKGLLSFAGRGALDEIDFIRAEAFGERTTNYFTGRRVAMQSEKARISGYRK